MNIMTSQLSADTSTDIAAVTDLVISAYCNGAYNALDTITMAKGFHPEFAIIGVGEGGLGRYTIGEWIAAIEKRKSALGFDLATAERDCDLISIDVTGDAANVKMEVRKDGAIIYNRLSVPAAIRRWLEDRLQDLPFAFLRDRHARWPYDEGDVDGCVAFGMRLGDGTDADRCAGNARKRDDRTHDARLSDNKTPHLGRARHGAVRRQRWSIRVAPADVPLTTRVSRGDRVEDRIVDSRCRNAQAALPGSAAVDDRA